MRRRADHSDHPAKPAGVGPRDPSQGHETGSVGNANFRLVIRNRKILGSQKKILKLNRYSESKSVSRVTGVALVFFCRKTSLWFESGPLHGGSVTDRAVFVIRIVIVRYHFTIKLGFGIWRIVLTEMAYLAIFDRFICQVIPFRVS